MLLRERFHQLSQSRTSYIHLLRLRFFFSSIASQAKETQRLIYKILNLREETETILKNIKSPYTPKLINLMFSKPIFLRKDFTVEKTTARRILKRAVALGVLKIINIKGVRGKVYVFGRLIRILSY